MTPITVTIFICALMVTHILQHSYTLTSFNRFACSSGCDRSLSSSETTDCGNPAGWPWRSDNKVRVVGLENFLPCHPVAGAFQHSLCKETLTCFQMLCVCRAMFNQICHMQRVNVTSLSSLSVNVIGLCRVALNFLIKAVTALRLHLFLQASSTGWNEEYNFQCVWWRHEHWCCNTG